MTAATEFFERRLPAMVVQRIDDFFAQGGRIAFDVDGQHFTFEFASADIVTPGLDDDAELKLTFTAPAFDAFVGGTLDPVAAIRAGEVSGDGDFELLQAFGVLLMPFQRGVGWDAGL